MGDDRVIRAATLLGPNTIDGLEQIVVHLCSSGHNATVVPLGAGEVSEAAADSAVDLVWACGLLTAELVAEGVGLDVVAAPVFPGERKAVYRSVIVTRSGEPSPGRRLAVNEFGSWSGYRALVHDAGVRADSRWHPDAMDEVVITGAHVESLSAVADGRADLASIDHSIWDWLQVTDPDALAGLTTVARTGDSPAPPISLRGHLPTGVRDSLVDALLEFPGPPLLVPASIDHYRFMFG